MFDRDYCTPGRIFIKRKLDRRACVATVATVEQLSERPSLSPESECFCRFYT